MTINHEIKNITLCEIDTALREDLDARLSAAGWELRSYAYISYDHNGRMQILPNSGSGGYELALIEGAGMIVQISADDTGKPIDAECVRNAVGSMIEDDDQPDSPLHDLVRAAEDAIENEDRVARIAAIVRAAADEGIEIEIEWDDDRDQFMARAEGWVGPYSDWEICADQSDYLDDESDLLNYLEHDACGPNEDLINDLWHSAIEGGSINVWDAKDKIDGLYELIEDWEKTLQKIDDGADKLIADAFGRN